MSDRFNQVLEEASRRVSGWPEWKKSEALKQSERLLKSKLSMARRADEDLEQPKATAASAGK